MQLNKQCATTLVELGYAVPPSNVPDTFKDSPCEHKRRRSDCAAAGRLLRQLWWRLIGLWQQLRRGVLNQKWRSDSWRWKWRHHGGRSILQPTLPCQHSGRICRYDLRSTRPNGTSHILCSLTGFQCLHFERGCTGNSSSGEADAASTCRTLPAPRQNLQVRAPCRLPG